MEKDLYWRRKRGILIERAVGQKKAVLKQGQEVEYETV